MPSICPLTRQIAIYAGEGVVSTLADWVGAAAASLVPLWPQPASMPTTPTQAEAMRQRGPRRLN